MPPLLSPPSLSSYIGDPTPWKILLDIRAYNDIHAVGFLYSSMMWNRRDEYTKEKSERSW